MPSAPSFRDHAERYLLLLIVAFVVAVVGTRWYLQATGYPQVGGGELHVAHVLWGGLLLVVAVMVGIVFVGSRVVAASAVLAGIGTGLFVDEIGKFITASNDYFYPAAAPLIYGLLLMLLLVFVILRRRPGAGSVVDAPPAVSAWVTAHLPRRRHRRILVAWLLLLAFAWLATLALFLLVDEATLRQIVAAAHIPGERIERPDEPFFYILEAAILGGGGLVLLIAGVLLGLGHEHRGIAIAVVGLVIALTAGAIVSFYVEQISAISATLVQAAVLLAVLHYRGRFLEADPAQ